MLLMPFARSRKPSSQDRRNLVSRRRALLLESLEDRRLLTVAAYIAGPGNPWGNTENDTAMDVAFGAANWDRLTFTNAVSSGIFTPGEYQFLFFDGSDHLGDEIQSFINAHQTQLEAWVDSGGSALINAGRNTTISNPMSVGFGATLTQNFSSSMGTAAAVDGAHPIFNGPESPVGTTWSGNYFAHDYVTGLGFTPLIVNGNNNPILSERAWGSGHVMVGGMTTPNFHSPQPAARNLRANIFVYAAAQANTNQSPTADPGGSYTIDEGDSITLDASGSSDPNGDTLTYFWDIDNDGVFGDVMGATPSLSWAQLVAFGIGDDGSYPIAVQVSDGNGGTDIASTTVTVNNVAPQLDDIAITPSINENDFAVLTGNITDPGTLDTFTLNINWGDPLSPNNTETIDLASPPAHVTWDPVTRQFSVTHQYLDDNPSVTPFDVYFVTASVTDDDGGMSGLAGASATTQMITNGGFETGDFTGWNVINSGSGGWGINDGTFIPLGPGNALPPISGNFDAVSFQSGPGLRILSEPIIVPQNVTSAVLSWQDRIRNFSNQFSDPNQEWRVLILDGSGGLIQEAFSTNPGDQLQQVGPNSRSFDVTSLLQTLEGQAIHISFQQQDNLNFFNATLDDVSLLVETSQPLEITVNNVAPAVDPLVLSSAVIDENGSITVDGTFTDPGTLDTHEVVIDWGDGSAPTVISVPLGARSFSATHQYLDDDPTGTPSDDYTITATVTDDDTGAGVVSATITVENVAPVITTFTTDSPFCGSADENEMVTATLDFTDPGSLDTYEVIVDWGDGNSETIQLTGGERTLSPTHAYATGGVFNVTVSVADDDMGIDFGSTTVVVTGVGVVGNTLYVVGTDGDDHVSINQTGNGLLKVHASFLADPDEPRVIDPSDYPGGISHIVMILCSGDDHATISDRVMLPVIIDGGDGDDHLKAGGGGAVLLGGNGNDMLIGGSGNDILIGGTGLDRLVGGRGEDFLAGGYSSYGSNSAAQTLADDQALLGFLQDWGGTDSREARELSLDALVNSLIADGDEDKLTGAAGEDWFFADGEDLVTDLLSKGNGRGN